MELIALPAFSDNTIWMLHDGARALVVDPGDAAFVQRALDARQLELGAILVTYHHADHVGGVDALRPRLRGFSAGCGRLFEGTPAQMHAWLSLLAALPGATRVCCTHEYTLSNLRFAHAVEPDNGTITAYTAWCEGERAQGRPTLPSTIERERQINPFLRCRERAVAARAGAHGASGNEPVAVFAALREWKNQFR
jgi:glyoxylase-like metal-dependent hydrolase (beta-lactamase superfamily II)